MADKPTNTNWQVIKCPYCGYEYTPADLFIPGELIGRPDSVVRDALGKILYLDYKEGEEPCQTTEYCCDECGKTFLVEPVISYKVKKQVEEKDFSNPYVSLLDE